MISYKLNTAEKLFKYGNIVFMVLVALIFVVPFYLVLVSSFITEAEITRRGDFILWPQTVSLGAYRILFMQSNVIMKSLLVTLFRVVAGTFLCLLMTAMFAFGLARRKLPGRKLILGAIFFTMIFNGGLVPSYLLVKSLSMIDSLWSMIVPCLISTWNLIIMKNYFLTIPDSLEESAIIDGATPFRTLISIIIPVSMPMIATIGMFYAVFHWNSWFDAAIYINTPSKYPLQIILRNVLLQGDDNLLTMSSSTGGSTYTPGAAYSRPPEQTMRSALIIFTTLPIICVYPFVQKYFIKGIMIGSIKE